MQPPLIRFCACTCVTASASEAPVPATPTGAGKTAVAELYIVSAICRSTYAQAGAD